MKDLQYRSVNEEENNVVLYNKASGETSVLDYNEDTSLMYIYGPRISTHFNFLPLNYSYISISDGDKYLNNLDDKGNRHVWNSKLVPLIEQETAFNMLNNIVANRTLSFKEIIEKSGGGAIDKFLGGFFGLFRAALMVLILSILGTMTALTEEEAWRSAVTRPYLEYSISLVIPYLPDFINENVKINFE